jgi:hypothetical protein
MKTKLITTACALLIGMASSTSAFATTRDPAMVVTDAIIVRPICFLATAIGSVFFVVALPVAATSHSVRQTADALVVGPARATFTRPLGDMDALIDY